MTDAELFMKMRAAFKEAEAFVEAAADRIKAQAAEIERLRGDLEKAVEAGKTMDDGCDCERCNKARATLAELTGGKDD